MNHATYSVYANVQNIFFQGSETNPLVVLGALTAAAYGAAALPHLAVGLFCPKKNCWPALLDSTVRSDYKKKKAEELEELGVSDATCKGNKKAVFHRNRILDLRQNTNIQHPKISEYSAQNRYSGISQIFLYLAKYYTILPNIW